MLTEPIVEGAWYLTKANTVVGPAQWEDARRKGWWVINGASYSSNGQASELYPEAPDLTRRVYVVPTDPAEVVAELQRMAHICSASAESAGSRAFDTAADIVAEKLGVK